MKRAVAYVYLKCYGDREDLVKVLGEELVIRLAMQGYITQGTAFKEGDGTYPRTWKKTSQADEYFNVMIKPVAEVDAENGRYLHTLDV